jgi:hypothetical protein
MPLCLALGKEFLMLSPRFLYLFPLFSVPVSHESWHFLLQGWGGLKKV